tara:strand:+ start:1676 stop:2146 length:471 start_codon:yes stop_codon:yes gene_type:complete
MSAKKLDLRDTKKKAKKKDDEKLIGRQITFDVEYTSPEGVKYQGSLTSEILDHSGRTVKTKIIMNLLDGIAFDSLPRGDRLRIDALSKVLAMLQDPPKWVTDAIGEDDEFLDGVAKECARHEFFFFQGLQEADQKEERTPRFSISSDLPPIPPLPS